MAPVVGVLLAVAVGLLAWLLRRDDFAPHLSAGHPRIVSVGGRRDESAFSTLW